MLDRVVARGTQSEKHLAKTVRRQTARLAYSIERLAKESDISRSMIYEEITAGRLIARKVGRRTVVRRSDALRWLRLLPPLGAHDQSNEVPDDQDVSSSS